MSKRTESSPRVIQKGPASFPFRLDYSDGYHVTVGWSEDDGAWIARCSGTSVGEVIADGVSKEMALLDLACSLAATIDAVNEPTINQLLTTEQAAKDLSISAQTLANWRATGRHADQLPHVKIGGAVRYRSEDIRRVCREGLS